MTLKDASSVVSGQDLLKSAQSTGNISRAAAVVVADMISGIRGALGTPVENISASSVFLVSMLPDDSGSIRSSGNEQLVRDGHNMVIEALRESKQAGGILAHCKYLNGTILYPFTLIDQAVFMDANNYQATGTTPLL